MTLNEPPEGDPAQTDLSRRSKTPGVSVTLVIGGLIVLGLLVYAQSAIF